MTLIKGQILIEHLLDRFIESSIKNPSEFDRTRFTFSEKLQISLMLGLPVGIKDEITLIYKLRNQIAHKLSYDNKQLTSLLNKISKYQKIHQEGMPLIIETRFAISFICGVVYAAVMVNRPDFIPILDKELEGK
jgi:translation initiation factor 2 beta subunit (eIF-2beta)/eIF-5